MTVDVGKDNTLSISNGMGFFFQTPRHGFYMEIPTLFGDKRVSIHNVKASETVHEDDVSSNWTTFRIGDEDRTVVGNQHYTVSYDYRIGKDSNKEYDEIYFNLVGNGWECPIDKFSFTINLPEAAQKNKIWLTGGAYGSKDSFPVTLSADGKTITGSAANLGDGKGLTIRVELPEGYFSEVKDYSIPFLILSIILGVFALVVALLIHQKYGKDEMIVPVVRFTPPDGLTPMEVGFLADGMVDNKDLTSMLFYWADKGCLTIKAEGKKDYSFTKIKEPEDAKPYELSFFNAFFECGQDGVVGMDELKTKEFLDSMNKTKEGIQGYFQKSHGLKDQKAESKRIFVYLCALVPLVLGAIAATINFIDAMLFAIIIVGVADMVLSDILFSRLANYGVMKKGISKILLFLAVVLLNLVAFFLQWAIAVGANGLSVGMCLATAFLTGPLPAIISVIGVYTAKRSKYGTQVLEQILGYREFISKVEMDKLKLMIDKDPELFYHVLSYAIVLGLEEKWAKKFEGISISQPSWYYDPMGDMISYMVFSNMTRGLQNTMAQHLYHEASHGGGSGHISSFSGSGGFSGGGYGGGGGGAW